MIRKLLATVFATLAAGNALADWELNMPRGVTELSAETYDIHMTVFWWCVWIGAAVFGAMIYSIFSHRKSKGVKPAQFSHSTTAEIVWTVIPVIILLIMVVPAAELMIRTEDTRNPDMTIVATGYQWKWHYAYQGEDVEFFSNMSRPSATARLRDSGIDPESVDNYLRDVDNPMVVPRGAKIRLLLTSGDVIHAWWVPELAIKRDAVPGYINETWFQAEEIGTFRGQCAELCGMDHGYMPIVVEVLEPEDYENWLDRQRDTTPSMTSAAGETQ